MHCAANCENSFNQSLSAHVENPALGHKVEKNTTRKERTMYVLSIQRESGNGTKKNTREKRQKQRKKERNTCVWLSARLHVEGRLNKGEGKG